MARYKLIFPFLSLALLASSCSQEELERTGINDTDGRIEFRMSLPEITRATEITTALLDEFSVSSLTEKEGSTSLYFLEKTFIRNTETNLYYSNDKECIWPNNNDMLRFYAYYPVSDEISTEDGTNVDVKIASDIAAQVDYVTAIGKGNLWENEETPITLKFRHQLSRIMLKAWGNSPSYDIEIAGVRMGGIGTEGVFSFNQDPELDETDALGTWESISNGSVEYIYREGDTLVALSRGASSPSASDKAVSILGSQVGSGYDNSAMVIPSEYGSWDFKENAANGKDNAEGMYFAVLMRVTDATSYNPGNLVYPYTDNEEGMEVICLAVDKGDGKSVKARVYTDGESYFSDEECTRRYDPQANNAEVKTFGWAALPVAAKWEPGLEYTYTLNYTNGVGLRIPTDPQPGKPILSDRVLVEVEMASWEPGKEDGVTVPRK